MQIKKFLMILTYLYLSMKRIGLVGINGTGKSTLLKVIGGLDEDFTADITHLINIAFVIPLKNKTSMAI